MKASSFRAIAGRDARVLILGTLPGATSLAAGQYYAQSRNVFWRIMGELVGATPMLPYEGRIQRLIERRIALWDVCAGASRQGSLDTSIRSDSVVPNDIDGFLLSHTDVGLICFNGTRAQHLFDHYILPGFGTPARAIRRVTLPSTSPAHAGMSYEKKLAAWRRALTEREA